MKKIIVVGAGAAGMMAAIAAARNKAQVTVLEAMDRPGKKLLITGNGRCNLTNLDPELPHRYYGSGKALASTLTEAFSPKDTLSFFESIGLFTMEKNGYVYPCTNQSVSVLDVLLTELRRLKVKMKFTEKVTGICKVEDGTFEVTTTGWHYDADCVILTCGSKAVPITGSDGSGYVLAQECGHRIVPVVPALCALNCKEKELENAAGVRTNCEVTLFHKNQKIASETGELQWTKYGLSGIVIFQLSRFVSCSSETGFSIHVNLLYHKNPEQIAAILCERRKLIKEGKSRQLFEGLFHEKLIPFIYKKAGISEKLSCEKITEEQIRVILQTASDLKLEICSVRSFEECQVCAGGVEASELDQHLQSEICSNLYFAGEIVDVDGPCGGYNLQWAWSSGYTAGTYAATI